jgi:hypothetical protein
MKIRRINIYTLFSDPDTGYFGFTTSVVPLDERNFAVYDTIYDGSLRNISQQRVTRVLEGIKSAEAYVQEFITKPGKIVS